MHDEPLPFRDPPYRPHAISWRGVPLVLLVFLLAFVGTGYGLRLAVDRWGAPLDTGEMGRKLAWYQANKAEIDTVFVGTSRVAYDVDQRAFDAETARLGCPTRSFNLALGGLNHRELLYLLDLVADDPPPRLKLVLFEPRPNPGRDFDTLMSGRMRQTLTPETFLLSLDEINTNPRNRKELAYYMLAYVGAFTYHNLGIGTLTERVLRPRAPSGPEGPEWEGDRRGFMALGEEDDGSVSDRSPRFKGKSLADWHEDLARYPDTAPKRRPSSAWIRITEPVLQITDRFQVPVVAILPPSSASLSMAFEKLIQKQRPGMPVVHLQPINRPELYDVAYWWDEGHLNAKGAAIYSTLLAREVCPLVGTAAQHDADKPTDRRAAR